MIASSYDCARYPHNGVEITSYNRDIFATPRKGPGIGAGRDGRMVVFAFGQTGHQAEIAERPSVDPQRRLDYALPGLAQALHCLSRFTRLADLR